MTQTVHPTAIVNPGARLGASVSIGPYAVIEDDVVVGDDCVIAGHAVIKRHTRMGRGNRVYEHAVIGGDPQDYKFRECESFVSIGDGNLIREGVTIHRGSTPDAHTRVGNECFLMANCHIAHDCTIGNGVVIANGTLLGGVVSIDDRAFVSGAVTIHQFCRVGRFALLAASTRVNQDCLPFVVTDGVPGRARGLNLVGLKRGGMPADEIAALRRAFHALRTAGSLEAALAAISSFGSPAAAELAEFIRASKRGFAHPAS